MSTKTHAESATRSGGSLTHQPRRFAGLFLAPLAGLPIAWLIHVWTSGIDLHAGSINWTVPVGKSAEPIAITLLSWVTMGMCWVAWHFTAHRETPKRAALTVSVGVLGVLFEINVGTGPHYWWSPLFVAAGWTVAVTWSLARLDVARNDQHAGETEEKEDGLAKKLGISKLTKFFPKVVHDEKTGEPVRIDIETHHAPGETVAVMQEGIGSLESVAQGPPGMSTAVGDPDRADRSTTSLLLVNPFRQHIPVGPPTSPGGSIADLTSIADYADGKPAFVTTAAGKHMASSTSYALIGMTRAGKTGTETQLLTEWGSRIDWVCLYLNQAKGLQDIRPLLPIIEAAVIAEDGEAGLGEYVVAAEQIKAIMIYRQQRLGQFAVSAWSPRCCDPNPDRRPTAIVGGRRVPMERMPFLTAHFGEADSILASGRLASLAGFVASKGLSLGINSGWSLQRPDWKAMPTDLRANIGLWFVHGMNNTDEEDFVLDQDVRMAGAHPGKWGQRKPGQHIMTGPGIDEARFPIALKTRFLVGDATDERGRPIDFDTLNDRYMAEMLRRNIASAPKMAKLDRGSADATDGWWDAQAAKTIDLRTRMLDPQSATESATAPRNVVRLADRATPQPATGDADDEIDPEEMEEMKAEFEQDVAETTEVDGIELYGNDDDTEAIRAMDTRVEFRAPDMDDDPLADSAEDDKPAAVSAEQARTEVRATLVRMLADRRYADRKVPGTALVTPAQIFTELGLRSRPWVSAQVTEMLIDGGSVADGVMIERHGDPRKGQYRLRSTSGDDHSQ
jgi:hypothetical protein